MATELRLHGLARQGNRSLPARISIQYRWEIGSGGLVVEAYGHQGRLHDQPQVTVEASLEHFMVSCREQKAWSGKRRRRTDQRLELLVGLGDCVSKKAISPAYSVIPPICSTTFAVFASIASRSSPPRSKTCTRPHSRLHAVMSFSAAGLTSDPDNLALSVPGITDSGSRVWNPSFV